MLRITGSIQRWNVERKCSKWCNNFDLALKRWLVINFAEITWRNICCKPHCMDFDTLAIKTYHLWNGKFTFQLKDKYLKKNRIFLFLAYFLEQCSLWSLYCLGISYRIEIFNVSIVWNMFFFSHNTHKKVFYIDCLDQVLGHTYDHNLGFRIYWCQRVGFPW